ncbi:hypothetical protein FACS1894187_06900 [Synergistales bacterium]|nr:hypothetical protein FACS1894187_06900 [Synergistales bacterium]
MRKDQYPEFINIMKRVATLTYKPKNTDFNELVLALFEELAPRYELSQVETAVRIHVNLEKFFPMLSDIVKRIDGTPEERATMAWALVVEAVRHIGHSNSVAFPTPAYNFAIRQMGGWIALCPSLRDEELKWRGKEFERAFIFGEREAVWDDTPGKIRVERYCVGSYEVNNRAQGHALPDVIDAKTRQPIVGFRDSLPALDSRVMPLLKALTNEKRALCSA